ncbi:NAD(P)/FAD-dependent oxidoreductase [Candidatus Bandiella euplotis]|uniref:Ferredoxin--NADP reductase n=1 Tax=Candidatus Bandiella euplotis TaxID=1664265 RepID=A0ABZ0UPN9_9RICK|nr:NAD(P)/FAD-dependent oxidoreductase [Candidatus Bandiella woodruffii]WPX96673.1 Putative NAD(P)/FAD-dependent ferredoxin oxidoreductase [Candidatus Bandiella woodruffii]
MNIYDIAIIGAGPVGLFTVFQAGMLGLKVCVVETLGFVGGQCSALYPQKPIYDIPGFHNINAQELVDNLKKQAAPFNPQYFLDEQCLDIKKEAEHWLLTSHKNTIRAKVIIIAAGGGSFDVRKPPLKNIDQYENTTVFYHVANTDLFKDKVVTIAGGGDSALDWAIVLAKGIAKKVYIIHRRPDFRAAPKTVAEMNELRDLKKIEIITPYQLETLEGANGRLSSIIVKNLDNELISLKSEYLLAFFGMSMNIGCINNWGLSIKNKYIEVDPSTMQTNLTGVFAVGDICNYPGKLKLILTGFAEGARACHSAYTIIRPEVPLHFEHSTTKGLPGGK